MTLDQHDVKYDKMHNTIFHPLKKRIMLKFLKKFRARNLFTINLTLFSLKSRLIDWLSDFRYKYKQR